MQTGEPKGTTPGTLSPRPMTTVRTLDTLVQRRHLLTHPFYQDWSCGKLSLETLREYSQQYYHFEANFPRYVGATYARLESQAQRRVLLENLLDEEGRPPTHPELWLDFARSLGAPARPSKVRPPSGAARALCRAYERSTLEGTAASGLGALYAYESQFPEIAAEKSRGLKAFYGIDDPQAHEFFRVHTFADKEHAAAERATLKQVLAADPKAAAQARKGTQAALDAWWGFLDSFSA